MRRALGRSSLVLGCKQPDAAALRAVSNIEAVPAAVLEVVEITLGAQPHSEGQRRDR